MRSFRPVIFIIAALLATVLAHADALYFQAHRGGLDEVPENTLAALEYAWSIPGAVPEVDLRTTQDGVPVIIHDRTPARTTDAPPAWAGKDIREIPLATLRGWDAGSWFDKRYAGAVVPTFAEVLARLKAEPARELYLDLKDVDQQEIIEVLKANAVTDRIIFVHGSPETCAQLSRAWPGARTMTWLSGDAEQIKTRFRALASDGFPGITQLQLHLRPRDGGAPGTYALEPAFLQEAKDATDAAGVTLQLRPFEFDPASLRALIDLGVRWFVADAPGAFRHALDAALALPGKPAVDADR